MSGWRVRRASRRYNARFVADKPRVALKREPPGAPALPGGAGTARRYRIIAEDDVRETLAQAQASLTARSPAIVTLLREAAAGEPAAGQTP
jgi:hypothetical protein